MSPLLSGRNGGLIKVIRWWEREILGSSETLSILLMDGSGSEENEQLDESFTHFIYKNADRYEEGSM